MKKIFFVIPTLQGGGAEKVISNFISTKIEWVPLNSVQIKNDKQNDLIEFLESLEEDDDVQNIFSNINFGGN